MPSTTGDEAEAFEDCLVDRTIPARHPTSSGSSKPVEGDDGGRRSGGPPDSTVAAWDATAVQAFGASGLSTAEGYMVAAYASIAVYDAVMAVEGGYEPFAIDIDGPDAASPEAAVAAAARGVLVHYLPAQAAAIIEPAYASSLAAIADGQAETDGVAIGDAVATQFIERRADDGFRAPVTYTPPNPPIPGVWLPTASTPPVGPYLKGMAPFSLRSADQYRPNGPPRLDSRRWARDYNEVKDIGSATSTTRTAEQTLAARFWAEPPVQQSRGSFRRFVLDHQLDIVDAARFMAMVSVTQADAFIACFDAKYEYTFWRPITAIRAAAPTTTPPPSPIRPGRHCLPGTPNHPEYPSAHSCITPAAGRVIARFLRTPTIDFTVPSVTGLGDRHFTYLHDLQDEVGNARIWGGIHFRTAVDDGITISRHVANWVLAHHFHRSHD